MTSNLIPASRVALTDPRTELPSREWYLFWYNQALLTADRQVQITALEGQITALGSRTTVLEADVAALEARVTTLENGIVALEARVTTLENEIVALKAELQALLVPFSDGFSYGFAS